MKKPEVGQTVFLEPVGNQSRHAISDLDDRYVTGGDGVYVRQTNRSASYDYVDYCIEHGLLHWSKK